MEAILIEDVTASYLTSFLGEEVAAAIGYESA